MFEVSRSPVIMSIVPDLHDPIFEQAEVLPAATGRSHPELADSDISKRDGAKREKFFFVVTYDVRNITDVRAGPFHPDIERNVRAEYHKIRRRS